MLSPRRSLPLLFGYLNYSSQTSCITFLSERINVTVLKSINCTLKSTPDCFWSPFTCILGSLFPHSLNRWIQKKDTWSIERDKVFTDVFVFFNMLTMIRPLTRFFPICLTFKILHGCPRKKIVREKPKTKKSLGRLQTKTKLESRGLGEDIEEMEKWRGKGYENWSLLLAWDFVDYVSPDSGF